MDEITQFAFASRVSHGQLTNADEDGAKNTAPTSGRAASETSSRGLAGNNSATPEKEVFFYVLAADERGKELDFEEGTPPPPQHPEDPRARQITYYMTGLAPLSQMEFVDEAESVVHALNDLYPASDPSKETRFRLFYERVFGLACLVLKKRTLEGDA